ncbi:SPOR domain-containing protein [Marinomonas transparens]|uniref:SPOR domain-containing protein n=1 Tax=Marinomonas transparens TaxID=2795388 RepID=A0A934MX80_9GAMM|nr:SPOR domain-containing protein [Marinomonas transparens]MBJ7539019.1 SPOR domain-containing protein [Marinomonas transparens]
MIDRSIVYRLIGAGIIVLSAAVLLPLILDGERPAELDVQVNVTEPPAFPVVKIAPVQPVDSMSSKPQKTEKTEAKAAQDISLLPAPKKTVEPKSIAKAEPAKQILAPVKKVPAPVKKITVTEKKAVLPVERWTVQIGSFKNQTNATGLVKKLKASNYDAYSITKGSLYKVYVGPEFKRGASETTRDDIKKKFGLAGIVVKYFVN